MWNILCVPRILVQCQCTSPWNKFVRDTVWENISNSNINTDKLLHFSTIWEDFPGCSVICRLSVAFSAAWISLGIWRCLLCGNAVVMSCKSALSMLIFLAKPLALFQGPFKSWWQCPQLQQEPLHFHSCFFSLSAWKNEPEKVWPLLGESSIAEHELLLLTLSSFLDARGGLVMAQYHFFGHQPLCLPSRCSKPSHLAASALERQLQPFQWSRYSLPGPDAKTWSFLYFSPTLQKSVLQEFSNFLKQPLPGSCRLGES